MISIDTVIKVKEVILKKKKWYKMGKMRDGMMKILYVKEKNLWKKFA